MTVMETLHDTSAQDYRELVFALVAGETPEPEAIRSALLLCHKSAEQLQADVARVGQRYHAARDLQRAEELQREQAELVQRAQALQAEYDQVQAECAARLDEARRPLDELNGFERGRRLKIESLDLRSRAHQSLRRTADPAIAARRRELTAKIDNVKTRLEDCERILRGPLVQYQDITTDKPALRENRAYFLSRIEELAEKIERQPLGSPASGWRQQIVEARGRLRHLDEVARELPGLRGELTRLRSEQDQAISAVMDWRQIVV